MQPQPVQQQVVITHSTTPRVRHDFAGRSAMFLGIMQLVTGGLCILLQIISIPIRAFMYFIGAGIWCGILFVIAGVFGILASRKKTNPFIITFMVMSIVSSVFFIALLTCSAIGVGIDANYRTFYHCDFNYGRYMNRCYYKALPGKDARLAINSLLLILSICELVFAIWSSILGCKVCCCNTPPSQPGSVQVQYVQSNQPQVMVVGQGGHVLPNHEGTMFIQGNSAIAYPGQVALFQQQQYQPQLPHQGAYVNQAYSGPVGMQQTHLGATVLQHAMATGPPAYQQHAAAPTSVALPPPADTAAQPDKTSTLPQ